MIFDKIYIINLKHRIDRRKNMINQMNKINETNYEFFDAIKPTIEQVNDWNSNYLKQHNDNYRIGCLGCMFSHMMIMKLALKENYNKILILEDDVIFNNNYNNLSNYLSNIDQNKQDMIYLSGSHIIQPEKITDNIYQIKKTFTTNSYIINKRAMEYIVNNINKYEKEIDVFYTEYIQKANDFNCICINPHITYQESGYSDIQNKDVNYKMSNPLS